MFTPARPRRPPAGVRPLGFQRNSFRCTILPITPLLLQFCEEFSRMSMKTMSKGRGEGGTPSSYNGSHEEGLDDQAHPHRCARSRGISLTGDAGVSKLDRA